MSDINTNVSKDGREVVIAIAGRFDFSVHKEFRDAYKDQNGAGMNFVLDLSRTEYMDSSALGMVLLLREHAGGDSARVMVRNATPEVANILRIANFDKLLKIN